MTRDVVKVPCVRCGVLREVQYSRPSNGTCRDCWGNLSREEKVIWAA